MHCRSQPFLEESCSEKIYKIHKKTPALEFPCDEVAGSEHVVEISYS